MSRQTLADILSLIGGLRAPPAPALNRAIGDSLDLRILAFLGNDDANSCCCSVSDLIELRYSSQRRLPGAVRD